MYVEQAKCTILEHFQGHYTNTTNALRQPGKQLQVNSNAHTHHLEGDTVGLHFAQAKSQGDQTLQDTSLEIHFSPPRQQEGFETQDNKLRNSGIRLHRCSAPNGLNIMEQTT